MTREGILQQKMKDFKVKSSFFHTKPAILAAMEEYANQKADLLLKACEEFVRKVECGEARSKKSYAEMKEAIRKFEES